MDLKGLIGTMRLGNCAISALGVLVGYAIVAGLTIDAKIAIAMAAAFFIAGAGNAINDYFDAEIDRKLGRAKKSNGKKSPLLIFSAILFAIGLALASILPFGAFAIAFAVCVLLVVYSEMLYRMKYIGNLVVALGTALTLVFGAALTNNVSAVTFAAAAAFFANVGREIIKDCEDISGDAGGKKTLPMILKVAELKKVIFLVYMYAIASGFIAFMLGTFRGIGFALLFAASAALFLNSFRLFETKEFGEAQKHSKFAMLAALASFVAGAL